ncbi:hypothetical protein BRC86_06765 [Halobacteriales archaeon QS_3_64_16]|nr:MAG: hypothetical protein BRC86_06765 [Halobacteriales archaeon QS_3_64_16]
MDVRLRVLLAVLLIIAPSVLFVLLYRGLLRLQDQELIARLAEAGNLDSDSLDRVGTGSRGDRDTDEKRGDRRAGEPGRNAGVTDRRAAFLRQRGDSDSRTTAAHHAPGEDPILEDDRELTRCGNCGTENVAEFGLCWNCFEWLD